MLELREAGYITKWGLNQEEKRQAYRLRAKVFCHGLRWADKLSESYNIETNEFDINAVHFVTLNPEKKVVATARIILSTRLLMIRKYFQELIPEKFLHRHIASSFEISRLAVSQNVRNKLIIPGLTVADFIYKALLFFSIINNLRFGYIVVSSAMLRYLQKRGLNCYPLSEFKRMPDGFYVAIAQIDWASFITKNRKDNPLLLDWYTTANIQIPTIHYAGLDQGENQKELYSM